VGAWSGGRDLSKRRVQRSFRAVGMVSLRSFQPPLGSCRGRRCDASPYNVSIVMPRCWGAAPSRGTASPRLQKSPDTGPAQHLVLASASSTSESFSWQALGQALTGILLSAVLTMNAPSCALAVSLSTDLKGQEVIRETLHEAWGEANAKVIDARLSVSLFAVC
jgi:hypothetical protein